MSKHIVSRDLTRYLLPMHPVVFISTTDTSGCDNIGVFATCLDISYNPPLILFASNKIQHTLIGEPNDEKKHAQDTLLNIQDTKRFIVNVPGVSMIQFMNTIARPFPRSVDEFDRAGLTKLPAFSEAVGSNPKIIGECLAHIECDLRSIINPNNCDHYLILGEVVCASVDDSLGECLEDIRKNLTQSVFGNLRASKDGKRSIGQILVQNIDSIIFSTDSNVFVNPHIQPKIPIQEPLFTRNY